MTANLQRGGRRAGDARCKLCREQSPLRKGICDECRGVAPTPRLLDVTPLRLAVEARLRSSDLSWTAAGLLLGYSRKSAASRLRRELGIVPSPAKGGGRAPRRHVGVDVATRIATALDLDPVDVGI